LTAVAHVVDLGAGALGVRRSGGSGRAVAGAGLGAMAGLFFGLPGLLIGPLVGAVAGELTVAPDLRAAGRAGLATWLGFLVGTVVKVALVVAMLAIGVTAFLF